MGDEAHKGDDGETDGDERGEAALSEVPQVFNDRGHAVFPFPKADAGPHGLCFGTSSTGSALMWGQSQGGRDRLHRDER